MDNTRYQVFVSSTYTDLKEERQAVIKTIIELNGIPAGMELFPATDEEQLAFIKQVIDDCDYYLLIIGGRYGSVSANGISYTEQEFDYAVSRGLKVIALIHEDPGEISLKKSDTDPVLVERLKKFREKVEGGPRLIKHWKNSSELPGLVATSLSHAIRRFPAVGWIRANRVASELALAEIDEMRRMVGTLNAELSRFKSVPAIEGLAGLDEKIRLGGTYSDQYQRSNTWSVDVSWREVFGYVSPYLIETPTDSRVKEVLTDALFKKYGSDGYREYLEGQELKTISIQLKALGLVELNYSQTTAGGMALFWSLTPVGERLMMKLRTVPSASASEKPKMKPYGG